MQIHSILSTREGANGRAHAIRYHAERPLPQDTPWDAHAARERLHDWATRNGTTDWRAYERGFGYVAAGRASDPHRYKLPHHDVRDGVLVTVWRGVAAAMAALLGAHGGITMSDEERRRVVTSPL